MSATNDLQMDPPVVTIRVGEKRYYEVDTTLDGGLLPGTLPNQIALFAVDESDGANVGATMLPDGVLAIVGNLIQISVVGDQVRRARVTTQFSNGNGQPARPYVTFIVKK